MKVIKICFWKFRFIFMSTFSLYFFTFILLLRIINRFLNRSYNLGVRFDINHKIKIILIYIHIKYNKTYFPKLAIHVILWILLIISSRVPLPGS